MSLIQNLVQFHAKVFIAGVCLLGMSQEAVATTYEVEAVDVTLVIRPDGNATVTDIVTWRTTGGTMGGFDFMDPAIQVSSFLNDPAVAIAENKNFPPQPVTIQSTGPQSWSIDTAGERLPEGVSYWKFAYQGNIIKSGKLEKRRAIRWGICIILTGGL